MSERDTTGRDETRDEKRAETDAPEELEAPADARAEIIEPGALTRRLQRGDVRAAIDVFDHEPLPMDDPLRSLDNVVLTPHVAWRDDEACVNLTRQVIDAVASYFTGGDYNAVL